MKLSVRITGTYIVTSEDAEYAKEIGVDVAIQQLIKQIKADELFQDFETVNVEIDVIDDKNEDDVEPILFLKNVDRKKRRRATRCNDPECEECQ